MEKKISVKNLYLLLTISIGLIGLGIGSTYAVFTAQAEIINPIVFNSNLTYDSNVMETVELTVQAGETKSTTLNISNSSSNTLNYTVWYTSSSDDIQVGTNSGYPTGSITSGSSTSITVDIRNNGSDNVTVILGISSSQDSVVVGQNMKQVPSERLPVKFPVNLATHITNLYLNNKDETPVTNNNISYRYAKIYDSDTNDATSGGLMNDRQGTIEVGEDEGNVRYYGLNPNNYIYFNCSDYNNQSSSTCELWRIIGVFEGKVKLIRNNPIGTYSWDNKTDGIGSSTSTLASGSNDWSDSRLMMLLNPGYDIDKFDVNNNLLNEHNRSYYYNSTGSSADPVKCYAGGSNATKDCYFDSTGLKNDTTRGLISETLWYLGGGYSASVYSDQMYEYERTTGNVVNTTRPTTWQGKVALAYPSDYGYAADFGSCNVTLESYNNTKCTGSNWMKIILGNSISGWLLTPYSSITSSALFVRPSGDILFNENADRVFRVAPVLHLNPELSIKAGDGSQNTPYQLAVS